MKHAKKHWKNTPCHWLLALSVGVTLCLTSCGVATVATAATAATAATPQGSVGTAIPQGSIGTSTQGGWQESVATTVPQGSVGTATQGGWQESVATTAPQGSVGTATQGGWQESVVTAVPQESTVTPPETTAPTPNGVTETRRSEALREIPFDTVFRQDNTLYEGEMKTVSQGVRGAMLTVTEQTYIDGRLIDTVTREDILFAPMDEIIAVGTKQAEKTEILTVHEAGEAFSTEYTYDNSRYDDEEEILREGQNGEVTLTLRITTVKGVETERETLAREETAPVSCLIRKGTKPSEETVEKREQGSFTPYTVQYIYDTELTEGERRLSVSGAQGYTETVFAVTYYHGEETGRSVLSSKVIPPRNEVIAIGTKKQAEKMGMPYVDAAHGGVDYSVTQYFGGSNSHGGVDFGVWYGDAIVSVLSGRVIAAYDAGDIGKDDLRWTYGTYVVIEHENGLRSTYAHLKDRTVSVGDTVGKGEIIGHSGNTGRVSPAPTKENPLAGTHLHFELRILEDGVYRKTDPTWYLPRWDS